MNDKTKIAIVIKTKLSVVPPAYPFPVTEV